MSRELLQQALDALMCTSAGNDASRGLKREAITALRAALAAPEAEPVGYVYSENMKGFVTRHAAVQRDLPNGTALYAAQPTPATFAQGYAEGFNDACKPAPAVPDYNDRLTEALYSGDVDKLNRVLAEPAPAVPQWLPIESAPKDGKRVLLYRPVPGEEILQARWREDNWGCWAWGGAYWSLRGATIQPTHWMPLPAAPGSAPAVREPLTDEQIDNIILKHTGGFIGGMHFLDLARATERAHGIGDSK